MLNKILFAYDGSDSAQHAAQYALQLACKFQSDVDVVTVFVPIQHGMDDSLRGERTEQAKEQGRALIEEILVMFHSAGITVTGYVEQGLPADAILKHARESSNDLIVMGSRGLNQAEGFLLGSVSDQVVASATCPVLVVK